MNNSNRVKLVVAGLVIVVVAIATISYGNSQRKKMANNDSTKSALPTIENTQKQNNNPSKPGESQPNSQSPSSQSQAETVPAPPPQNSDSSIPSTPQQGIQPQLPQGRTPATGPADNLLPVIVIGTLSGLYFASRKHLRLATAFDK